MLFLSDSDSPDVQGSRKIMAWSFAVNRSIGFYSCYAKVVNSVARLRCDLVLLAPAWLGGISAGGDGTRSTLADHAA